MGGNGGPLAHGFGRAAETAFTSPVGGHDTGESGKSLGTSSFPGSLSMLSALNKR